MNKIKKTFLKEKENDYKLRNPKIFSKYVIVLSKNNPNIKFTFIDIVFFLIVIFYIFCNFCKILQNLRGENLHLIEIFCKFSEYPLS